MGSDVVPADPSGPIDPTEPVDLGEPDAALGFVLRKARDHLAMAGVPDAALDARILMGHATGADPARLILEAERVLHPAERATFADLIARRATREPVTRILGHRDFYGRTFTVTPDVLDPRPDTEVVVEAAIALIRDLGLDRAGADGGGLSILDIGTGSGAILLTLLAELPTATGLGIDISPPALAIAAANARALGLDARARFAVADLLRDPLPAGFNVWISNPPYIDSADIAGLAPEVRDHDPRLSLDGGADGLDAYRAILAAAAAVEPPDAGPVAIVFEVGARQADAVVALAVQSGLCKPGAASLHHDVAGHTRCVTLQPRRHKACEKHLDVP